MDFITIMFATFAVIGGGIAIWINTKSGKKWLSSL